MREVIIRKTKLRKAEHKDDLQGKSPHELIGMMWQLALNA